MYKLALFAACLALAGAASIDFPSEDESLLSKMYPPGKIVGGVVTDISKIPYQLALETYGRQFCGASILTSKIAITAAHCLSGHASSMNVRAGSSSRGSGGHTYKITKYVIHPKWDRSAIDYDVGLLFLASEIKFDAKMKSISLIDKEPTKGKLLLSGWGDLHEGSGSGSSKLMSVEVPIVDRKTCSKNYSSITTITSRMICAGKEGKDSCQGDSGGPAVFEGKLAGIVSFGMGCAKPNYPGVYSNLANPEMKDWIKSTAKL